MSPHNTISREEHWQAVYETKATDEVSWFQETPSTSLELIRATGISSEARIVDGGGGASTLVDHLLAGGYHNLAVLDLAEDALRQAKDRVGADAAQVDWIVADVTRWAPHDPVDVWHDRAVFHFLTEPEERQAYRDTLERALVPGGHAIIATFASDGPERCSSLPVMRHGLESLAEALGTDFTRTEHRREEHVTPAGRVQAFLYQRFRRRG